MAQSIVDCFPVLKDPVTGGYVSCSNYFGRSWMLIASLQAPLVALEFCSDCSAFQMYH
jgi:hypothetical protein